MKPFYTIVVMYALYVHCTHVRLSYVINFYLLLYLSRGFFRGDGSHVLSRVKKLPKGAKVAPVRFFKYKPPNIISSNKNCIYTEFDGSAYL